MKYPILIYPADEGGYVAEIISLPGCIAQGETYIECLLELETVAEYWMEENKYNVRKLPNSKKSI